MTTAVRKVQGVRNVRKLKRYLDQFLDTFPKKRHVAMDPVQFVHRYSDSVDREVVGFLAAAFSYGHVKTILATVEDIVSRMGSHPAQFVASFDPGPNVSVFRGFRHRWSNGQDLAVLLWILRRLLEDHDSLEAAVARGVSGGEVSVEAALDRFSREALDYGHERFYSKRDLETRRGVRYFFPRTTHGSACKRLNLFLRWMVRPDDGVDCGLWNTVTSRQLVIPVDTHVARISRYIGLTEIQSPGWKMALDITNSLKRLDGSDPLRYDFALCHLGIAGDCPRKRDVLKCARCPIQPMCKL